MSGLEVIAILGACKNGFEVLGKLFGLVQRYRHFPKSVIGLKHEITGCHYALEGWQRKWGVEPGSSEQLEKNWGKNGWKDVSGVLANLMNIRNGLIREINELVRCATNDKKIPDHKIVFDDRLQLLARKNIESMKRNTSAWKRFTYACKEQAGKIQDKIQLFDRQLNALNRISDGAAEKVHGAAEKVHVGAEKVHGTDSSSLLTRLESQSVITKVTGRSLRFFQEQQTDAILLHKAFKAGKEVKCYLGIMGVSKSATDTIPQKRLIIRNVRSGKKHGENKSTSQAVIKFGGDGTPLRPPAPRSDLDHHFLLSDSLSVEELLVQPMRFDKKGENLTRDGYLESFSGSLEWFRRNIPLPGQLLPPSGSFEQGFLLWKTVDADLAALYMARPLQEQLGRWSLQEKIEIGHGLSWGLFRILGSPWGDYIESWNLRVERTRKASLATLLQACSSEEDYSKMLERATTNLLAPSSQSKKHSQIYRLGILLVELALSREISILEYDRDIGPRIVLDWLDWKPWDHVRIAAEVQSAMGEKFGDIVFFCLSVFQNKELVTGDNIDELFASRVLAP
jgi:hypothetical protein